MPDVGNLRHLFPNGLLDGPARLCQAPGCRTSASLGTSLSSPGRREWVRSSRPHKERSKVELILSLSLRLPKNI